MSYRFLVWLMRGFGLFFVAAAITLAAAQVPGYRQAQDRLPAGQVAAGVPVGGLTRTEALERLKSAYSLPVEMRYGEAVFQASPETLGFRLEAEAVLDPLFARPHLSFWDYLWNRSPAGGEPAPLQASVEAARIRQFLDEQVAPRYDTAALPPSPVPGTIRFIPGQPGQALDVEQGVAALEAALRSPVERTAVLKARETPAPKPLIANLETMLKQQLAMAGFDGVAEIYLAGLQDGESLHFALQGGQPIPAGVAFTAASTIKIPVMVSVFQKTAEPAPEEVLRLLRAMIDASDNPSTDRVVQSVLDETLGPLQVSEDLRKLGLVDTFWGGYFYDGAPLLQRFTTPANERTDVNTHPDIYNQTTPAEMGRLLEGIYRCAQDGSGIITAAFPGEVTQSECGQMLELLKGNRIAVLLEAGLPEGTPIAHKHGWVQGPDGVMHDIADAGIVFSPGGDYVLTVYLYDPQQLLFDPANELVARLSRAVYNYFNPDPVSGD